MDDARDARDARDDRSPAPDGYIPEGIAVVGLAGRFPGARTVWELWQHLRDGVESITFFTDEELIAAGLPAEEVCAPNYVKARGILGDTELCDAAFFGLNPREAALMDPQHRLFLECAWEALETAGYSPEHQPGRVGVFAGQSMNTYLLTNVYPHLAHVASVESLQASIGNDKDSLTTEVAYRLRTTGPAVTIQSSSSTSLVAIHYACQSLLGYECDAALAGGVSIHFPEKAGYLYYEGGTTAPDGHCRVFDARAEGFVAGHGAGCVVLRRLADALAAGDTIYAVVKGSAVNNDGSAKVSYMAPSIDGQAEAIALAQAVAGVTPESIGYIEAHGTATRMGDPIEVAALTQAFRQGEAEPEAKRTGYCALGSVKSNIGHLDSAAGVTGFIKAALTLHHKQIPPSLHFERPNPNIDFDHSPFYVNTRLSPWPAPPDGQPRRAGVTSLGMGGTNAHCILEEAPALEPSPDAVPRQRAELLVLSARSAAALDTASDRLAAHLQAHPELALADVAHTLQQGRRRFEHRRVLCTRDLASAARDLGTRAANVWTSAAESQGRPVMFLFSGQGSQYVDMGRDLYDREPVFRSEVDACAEHLRPLLGRDLRHVLYPTPVEQEAAARLLGQTAFTQPALFVIELALARLWMSWGIQPQAMLGHSIGEYVAACLAGVLTRDDALALVCARGRLMQEMPSGAMLAVALPASAVAPHLGDTVSLAAVNSPASCVVAGPKDAIDALAATLTRDGHATTRLHTSHAFHSTMMEPMLAAFQEQVRRVPLKPPNRPYLSNVSGTWITAAEATSPEYWAQHLRHTVRYADGVGVLLAAPDAVLLEVGPGATLATLARQHPHKTDRHVVLSSLRHPRETAADDELIRATAGRLWLAGCEPDWAAMRGPERRRRVPLPTYPFERQRHWVEPKTSRRAPQDDRDDTRRPLDAWFYLPGWQQTPTLPLVSAGPSDNAPEAAASWWIFHDGSALADALCAHLRSTGGEVVEVHAARQLDLHDPRRVALRPTETNDYAALLARTAPPRRIVHLWSCTPKTLDDALELGSASLLGLVQALERAGHSAPTSVLVVTCSACPLGDRPIVPERATVLGTCRVIGQEYPHMRCRAVDIDAASAPLSEWQVELLSRQLQAEALDETFSEALVAYRGRSRFAEHLVPIVAPATPAVLPLRPYGTYLIVGGFGNIGFAHARALAQPGKARLVLIGRTALPERAAWPEHLAAHAEHDAISQRIRKVQALEALGAEVLALAIDITSPTLPALLQAMVHQVEQRFGAINGLVYAAGTVDQALFRTIRETGLGDLQAHLRTRGHALYALTQTLAHHPLDFCLIASSLASLLGGLGLYAYAASTAFLDAMAHSWSQRHPGLWLSVNWDAWRFEAQNDALTNPFGEQAISSDEGQAAVKRLLELGTSGQVAVSTTSLLARRARASRPAAATASDAAPAEAQDPLAAGGRTPRPVLQNPYVSPRDALETQVAALWQDTLGIDRVGLHDNFFDLGGNSLVGVRLIAALRERFKVQLPAVMLYEGPTVEALARLIRAGQSEAAGPGAAGIPGSGGAPADNDGDDLSQSRGERRRAQRRRHETDTGDDNDEP